MGQTSFFEHQTNLNMFVYWWSSNIESKTPSLDLLIHSSNRLEHHSFNIKRTRTCSSFGNQTQATYFWLWTIEHRTSNIVRPITNRSMETREEFVSREYFWHPPFQMHIAQALQNISWIQLLIKWECCFHEIFIKKMRLNFYNFHNVNV